MPLKALEKPPLRQLAVLLGKTSKDVWLKGTKAQEECERALRFSQLFEGGVRLGKFL